MKLLEGNKEKRIILYTDGSIESLVTSIEKTREKYKNNQEINIREEINKNAGNNIVANNFDPENCCILTIQEDNWKIIDDNIEINFADDKISGRYFKKWQGGGEGMTFKSEY